jgi:hypothetical protein
MPSTPRTPAEHYATAERLIAATEETPESAPLLAICHALLCPAPGGPGSSRIRLAAMGARAPGLAALPFS